MTSTIFEIHYRVSEVYVFLKRNVFSFKGLCSPQEKFINRYLLNILFYNLMVSLQVSPNQNHDSSNFSIYLVKFQFSPAAAKPVHVRKT